MDNTGTDDGAPIEDFEAPVEEFLALVRQLPKKRQREIAALVKRVAAEPDHDIRTVMIEESEADRTSGMP